MNESRKTIDQSGSEIDSLKNKIGMLRKENRELKDHMGAIYEEGRESEKIYRTLIDLSFNSYFIHIDGKIVFINPSGAESLGFSNIEEGIGKNIMDYIHPDYLAIVAKRQQDALEKGAPAELIEIKVIRPDGKIIDVEVAAAPFVYSGEKAVLVVTKDISKRKRAEDSLKRSETSLAMAQKIARVGNWDWDMVTNEITWSDEVFQIYGLNSAEVELTPKTFFDRIHPDDIEDLLNANKGLEKNNEPYEIECRMSRPDGEERIINVKEEAYFDAKGKHIRMVGTIQDVTERKRAEEELIAAKVQAEGATKLKDKFVSLVAHDLRSPFTSIVGLLRIMRDDATDPLSAEHLELLDRVLDSSSQQIHMIEELLNISRLQTGSIIPNKRFLDGALSAGWVIGNLAYLAEKKGITIENKVPLETRLYGDFDLFNEVLQNLVSNAIKFCKEGDVITLFVPPGQSSTIAVKDSGPGIDDGLLPILFKQEEKSSTLGSAGEKGSGLGLPYCHDIMASHGGELTVETKMGEGSQFCARLPYAKPKILIVDDQVEVIYAVKKYLEILDVDFIEAGNGTEGLDIIDENQPDIIISDIDMPVMDGFEFIEKIREKHDSQSIPIIVITGTYAMETKDKALRLGANDFAVKPLKAEEFLPRVKRFLT